MHSKTLENDNFPLSRWGNHGFNFCQLATCLRGVVLGLARATRHWSYSFASIRTCECMRRLKCLRLQLGKCGQFVRQFFGFLLGTGPGSFNFSMPHAIYCPLPHAGMCASPSALELRLESGQFCTVTIVKRVHDQGWVEPNLKNLLRQPQNTPSTKHSN
jgi:hypothetical protein